MVYKLAEYEELYLPQPALGELYYGAYRSDRFETRLAQIEQFLDAVDLLTPDQTRVGIIMLRLGAEPVRENRVAELRRAEKPEALDRPHPGRIIFSGR